jgi:2-amino-4-hydroxy-6-hydroxymethyldihydropteridine diphosphokinase
MNIKSLFVGLGSNLDSPITQLKKALTLIDAQAGFNLCTCSSFYQSPPMDKMDQPDYINAVCHIETSLPPLDCLDCLQAIENKMGRVRNKKHWQARTLDLDILLYDQNIIKSERLTVPHYGMLQRSFVMIPLLEIAPKVKHPEVGLLKNQNLQNFAESLQKVQL